MQCGCPDVMRAEDRKLHSHLEWPKQSNHLIVIIINFSQMIRVAQKAEPANVPQKDKTVQDTRTIHKYKYNNLCTVTSMRN